ncbi:MAG: portal protein [Caudoviricetes sp.]|nr:MAG: portal protein [Caudoviricetes sp.]
MVLFDWARALLGKLNRKTTPAGTIEKEFGVYPAASRKMEDNLNLWWSMYVNHPPWETDCVRPLGLPGAIGRELARHALTEFSVSVTGGARGDYIDQQVQAAVTDFGKNLELGLCLGGIALKPYPDGDRILVDASTTGFTPTRFDGRGKCIGGVFKSLPTRQGKEWFVRMEYHGFQDREDGGSVYVIENKAYRSGQDGSVGTQVALDSVDAWADLQEHVEIEGLTGPLFAYFKPPQANDIEPESQMGVSVYAGATVDLIKQADEKWEQIEWEYQSGERKIYADDNSVGKPEKAQDRLFIYRLFIYGDFTPKGEFFHEFSPAFRDDPLYNGFQRILQRIEFNVGLSYGTISDPQSVEKTATEILTAKHRQYVTEDAIQKAFEATLDGLIYAMNAWCDLAGLAPAGEYEVAYSWGDGVLDDPETRRQDMALDMQMVNAGLMNDWEYRVKWFSEDKDTARKMLPGMEDMTTEKQEEVE